MCIGVGITSGVLTDLLFNSLGETEYNPLHFRAFHMGLMSKRQLFNAATRLDLIKFLRYKLSFNVCYASNTIFIELILMNCIIRHHQILNLTVLLH